MDVLYYWKDIAEDQKADRIGWFRSSADKLTELQAGYPGYIWVIKTPKGMKGRVQLLARLAWSDTAKVAVPRVSGDSYIYYDPDHAQSVWFEGTDSTKAIEYASSWVQRHFPAAVRGNFQGANGQQALRGDVLQELTSLAATLSTVPFRTAPQVPT